ncbi:MAG: hypothetical protein LQ347_002157 [Umbilicaria vellea]|nr:MAG: hypothetical protein LQ347_002157 [Umbilicaria vellea]
MANSNKDLLYDSVMRVEHGVFGFEAVKILVFVEIIEGEPQLRNDTYDWRNRVRRGVRYGDETELMIVSSAM